MNRSMRFLRGCSIGLLILFMAACGSGSAPSRSFPIQTDADHYLLRRVPFGHQATIIARFTAPADTTVHLLHCNGAIGWGLQRVVDGRWANVWVAMTNGCFSPPKVVRGGAAHVETLTVVSRADAMPLPGPVQETLEPGIYRVVFHQVLTSLDIHARPMGEELPVEQRVSGPISIELER